LHGENNIKLAERVAVVGAARRAPWVRAQRGSGGALVTDRKKAVLPCAAARTP
jgi:hypothetical protein